MIELLEITMK